MGGLAILDRQTSHHEFQVKLYLLYCELRSSASGKLKLDVVPPLSFFIASGKFCIANCDSPTYFGVTLKIFPSSFWKTLYNTATFCSLRGVYMWCLTDSLLSNHIRYARFSTGQPS